MSQATGPSAEIAVQAAVRALARGEPVVVVDGADRENEGDLVFAAQKSTPELMGFMIRHCSGYVCVPMRAADLDRLELEPMVRENGDPLGTAYAVSVDVRRGVTTGISATDRAATARALADPGTRAADLRKPGHVLPLRARSGGVLQRAGHTEAAIDLVGRAGLRPAAVICELVHDDGTVMRLPALEDFARAHGLVLVEIADLVAMQRAEIRVAPVASTSLPTEHGTWRVTVFRSQLDATEHLALVMGEIGNGDDVLVRVHSECLTGDVFGSCRCDCGEQLRAAMRAIDREGRGVVLYVRGQEGRGIGLARKLEAYALQDRGFDTLDANVTLGAPVDARDYGTGAEILHSLGVRSMRLLTNNPDKKASMESCGLEVVEMLPLEGRVTAENRAYLETKRDRMGHRIGGLGPPPGGAGLRLVANAEEAGA